MTQQATHSILAITSADRPNGARIKITSASGNREGLALATIVVRLQLASNHEHTLAADLLEPGLELGIGSWHEVFRTGITINADMLGGNGLYGVSWCVFSS